MDNGRILPCSDRPSDRIPGKLSILVSNDDGIKAPGIKALVKELLAEDLDVTVCAPSSERSAQVRAHACMHALDDIY